MAIKIPSKNIYEISNPKIRDNLIDNVSVEENIIAPKETEDENYYKIILKSFSLEYENEENKYSGANRASYNFYNIAISQIFVSSIYANVEIAIPVLYKNGFWNLTLGKSANESADFNNAYNIKYSLVGKKEGGEARHKVKISVPDDLVGIVNREYSQNFAKEFDNYNIPQIIEHTVKAPQTMGLNSVETTAKFTVKDNGNLGTIIQPQISVIDGKEYYVLQLKILSGIKIIKVGFGGAYEYTGEGILEEEMHGEYESFTPERIEISFVGQKFGINLSNSSMLYGKGNKPIELSKSELLQDSGVVKTISESEEIVAMPISEYLAKNILNEYEKGKETATLLCDISDYYNESGEKVIDIKTNKMSFRLHDEVIPYVFGANGQDQPMSKNQNGTAKVFEVVGSNIIYDGAVWQELTLLEKK